MAFNYITLYIDSMVTLLMTKLSHCETLTLSLQDQKRVEKVSKRLNAIQELKESVSLLSQLLDGYSKETCSQSNQELIKVGTSRRIEISCSHSLVIVLVPLTPGVI